MVSRGPGARLAVPLLPLLLAGQCAVFVARSVDELSEGFVREAAVPPAGAPLPDVPVLRSANGLLRTTLRVQPVRLVGPNISLFTRSYNGVVPGPTLAVLPGDRLSVLLVNDLEDPLGAAALNGYHHPNHTNLHLHGLHVSPLPPSDSVLYITLKPKAAYQYEYLIPRDHSPGTYWAHPHYHGSGVLQAGAGAVCGLLVLDPPGFLSPQLEAISDRLVMLQNLPRASLEKAAAASRDGLFRVDRWQLNEDLWLVNGAFQPVLTVRPGEWHRLRLVGAGVATRLSVSFGACEAALLAKDGVYIADFPRSVEQVALPPGGRADVVVRCPVGQDGRSSEHVVASTPPAGVFRVKTFDGPLFTLRVKGTKVEGLASQDLAPWAPATRPSYLQDLRAVGSPTCSCATSLGGINSKWITGHLFEGPTRYMHRSPLDAVVERRLTGLDAHPYHQHTFPFQLMSTPAGNDPYFQVGDWHDTYLNIRDPSATVRFFTADFGGPQLVHCHNLAHSDTGMVAVEWVGGSGADQCGCDLLNFNSSIGAAEAGPQGGALLGASFAAFAGMLALVAVAAVRVTREWHQAVAASGYGVLPDGPAAGTAAGP